MTAVDFTRPLPVAVRPAPRLTALGGGLLLYGTSMALMIRSGLGLDPWDTLHQGLARLAGLSFGTITALVGLLVLVAWWPLRQRPGIGTAANVVVIGVAVDVALALLPQANRLVWQITAMVAGVVLNALATALYVGARFGPGPRDGLMTGLVARTGASIRLVRTGIEGGVLLTGVLLGGTVGAGTVLYAVAIGPLTQLFLRRTTARGPDPASSPIVP